LSFLNYFYFLKFEKLDQPDRMEKEVLRLRLKKKWTVFYGLKKWTVFAIRVAN
jgi:hypothetical protein